MKNFYKLNEEGKEYFTKQADEKGMVHATDFDEWDADIAIPLKDYIDGDYVLNEEYDPKLKNDIGFTEGLKYRLDGTTIFVTEELIDEED